MTIPFKLLIECEMQEQQFNSNFNNQGQWEWERTQISELTLLNENLPRTIKVQLTKEPRSPNSRILHQCQQPNEGISSHYQLRLRIPQCQIHKLQETQIENMSMNQNKPQAGIFYFFFFLKRPMLFYSVGIRERRNQTCRKNVNCGIRQCRTESNGGKGTTERGCVSSEIFWGQCG